MRIRCHMSTYLQARFLTYRLHSNRVFSIFQYAMELLVLCGLGLELMVWQWKVNNRCVRLGMPSCGEMQNTNM